MLRTQQYGRFGDEQDDFAFNSMDGRSIIVLGDSLNDENGGSQYLPGTTRKGFEIKRDTDPTDTTYSGLIQIQIAGIRAILGFDPILVSARLRWQEGWQSTSTEQTLYVYRMTATGIDITSCTNKVKDASPSLEWGGTGWGLYWPLAGVDYESTALDSTVLAAHGGSYHTGYLAQNTLEIKDAVEWCLRGRDSFFLFFRGSAQDGPHALSFESTHHPYIDLRWLYPVEMYPAKADGTIDMSASVIGDSDGNSFYLGAVARGANGIWLKGFLKNLTSATLPYLELIDDHPEWENITQIAGSSGGLDYVTLDEDSVSQKWSVKIVTGTTTFEVVGEAYGDNATAEHAAYDATPAWQGTVGVAWSAPSGGLNIPAEAWQGHLLSNGDEWQFVATGQTTDAAWPADSNEQIVMTYDDGLGAADDTESRIIAGRRTLTTATVTIDATSKWIPVRLGMVPANWTTGRRVAITDKTNINYGEIADTQEPEIGTDVFTGSGLDDLTLSGNYNHTADIDLRIEIDGTGTPDSFKYSYDDGSTWEATTVAITGAAQDLGHGILATFGATTGHTSADRWDAECLTCAIQLSDLTADSTSYAADSLLTSGLCFFGIASTPNGVTNADSGVSESYPDRVYIASGASLGFLSGQKLRIADADDPEGTNEEIEIGSVTSTYIELNEDMVNDYPAGAFVAAVGVGEQEFWHRVEASPTTDEELKQARYVIRR
jgi:hypothetical protein